MNAHQEPLFPGFESAEPAPKEKRTEGGRAKSPARPGATLLTGIHPTTRLPLMGGDATCAGCVHLYVAYQGRTVTDHACALTLERVALNPEWPACAKHEPKES